MTLLRGAFCDFLSPLKLVVETRNQLGDTGVGRGMLRVHTQHSLRLPRGSFVFILIYF